MPKKIKTILIWLLFALLIYMIVTQPDRAAGIVREGWDIIAQGFRNIGRFFDALME